MNQPVATIITVIALFAVLAARHGAAKVAARAPVARRLRTVYTLVALLLALRILEPLIAVTVITIALMLVASWLPIAALWLVEELCRRHAPRPLKLFAIVGAMGFSLLAVTLGLVWSVAAAIALAAYQLAMLAASVVLLARDRVGLGLGERRTADTLLMALLLTIPLAATDFAAVAPDLPVRGGAFAALLMALATSRLAAGDGRPRRLAADLLVAAGVSGASVFIAFAAVPNLPGIAAVLIGAGGAALGTLLLIVARVREESDPTGLISALAHAPADDRGALIASHPLLASGHVLGPVELDAYPDASIARLLSLPVISASTSDAEARDAARDLLDAFAATHLVRLSSVPPRLLAVAAGSLAAPALDDELALVARLLERAA